MSQQPPALQTRVLTRRFGGLMAVDGLDLTVAQGQVAGLIGPNGAGKTTVFNLLAGAVPPTSGSIEFLGRQIGGLKASRINLLGLARTFQNIRLFGELSVLENVLVGFHGRLNGGFWGAVLRLPSYARQEKAMLARAEELLELVGLASLAGERAENLAYGQQRLLEIARALATGPSLLLLDEPAAGMNPQETGELANLVRRLRDAMGITVLLIEHDMHFVMGLCEAITVLDYGRVIACGSPQEVQCHPEVIKAYLGGGHGPREIEACDA